MPSGPGVSEHIFLGRSVCLPDTKCPDKGRPDDTSHGIRLPAEECQGIFLSDGVHVFQMQSVMAEGTWMTRATACVFRTRSDRAYFSQMERISSRRKVSRQRVSGQCETQHMPSRRGVSVHISYRRSACLPDAKLHAKRCLDDVSHSICDLDEECQGIFLTDRLYVFLTQSVMAKGIWMTRATAYAFRTRSVRVYFLQMECMST